MKNLLVTVSLGLLALAAPLRAQIDLSVSDTLALPLGHSYILGLTFKGSGPESGLYLHTRSEVWQTSNFSVPWVKVFDPTLAGAALSLGSLVTAMATSTDHYFYTGGYAPALYDYQRSTTMVTGDEFGNLAYVDYPTGLLSTSAGVYLARPDGNGGGIDFFANPVNPAAMLVPTLTFAQSGAGALAEGGALALGADGLIYARDAAADRIVRYDAETGDYLSEFSIAPGIAANTFAISGTGLLFAANFEDGLGYIYDTATGDPAGSFDLPTGAQVGAGGKPSLLVSGDTLYATSGFGANIYTYDLGVVPEPSVTALFIGGSALMMAFLHRRKRKNA